MPTLTGLSVLILCACCLFPCTTIAECHVQDTTTVSVFIYFVFLFSEYRRDTLRTVHIPDNDDYFFLLQTVILFSLFCNGFYSLWFGLPNILGVLGLMLQAFILYNVYTIIAKQLIIC